MNKPYREIVLDILSIINYPKDRVSYAEEAEKSVITDVFINLVEKLPDEIKQQIEASKTEYKTFSEQEIENVRQHISPEDFVAELEKVSKEDIKEFVEELNPKVDEMQKQKLQAIVASLDEAPVVPSMAAPVSQDTSVSQENPIPTPQDPRAQ